MRKYKIKYTGFRKQNSTYTVGEKIVVSEVLLYPSELLQYILNDINMSENIYDNFSVDCEEMPEDTQDTYSVEDRQKWGILS